MDELENDIEKVLAWSSIKLINEIVKRFEKGEQNFEAYKANIEFLKDKAENLTDLYNFNKQI